LLVLIKRAQEMSLKVREEKEKEDWWWWWLFEKESKRDCDCLGGTCGTVIYHVTFSFFFKNSKLF
jgi:hypothetical protein